MFSLFFFVFIDCIDWLEIYCLSEVDEEHLSNDLPVNALEMQLAVLF